MESLRSDGSATYLLIIWVEKILPLAMKSKQKTYPSIVFLSIYIQVTSQHFLSFLRLRIPTIAWCAVGNLWAPQFLSCLFDLGTVY